MASEITILLIFFSSAGPFFHTDSSTTIYTLISLSSNTHIISYFSIYILPSLNALCREQSDYKLTTIKTSIPVFAAISYTSLTESIDLNAKCRAHYHPFQNDFSSSWHHQECKLKMLFYFCSPWSSSVLFLFQSLSPFFSYTKYISYYTVGNGEEAKDPVKEKELNKKL